MPKVGTLKAAEHGSDGENKLTFSAEEANELKDLLDQAVAAAEDLNSETKCGAITIQIDGSKLKLGTTRVAVKDDEAD